MKITTSSITTSIISLGLLICLSVANKSQAAPQDRRLPLPVIEETLSLPYQTVSVLGSQMAYLEQGKGDVVLFLHGNPTSAYLWRNILPYVAKSHRAVAIDLIGMGYSGKPRIAYTFEDHARYLEAFIDKMGFKTITLVGHDWGATLAWNYAKRHPGRVTRLAFMEGVLPPVFPQPSFEAMGAEMGGMFRALKDETQGREMVIQGNMFVEKVLPSFVNRSLGPEAMAAYRKPFQKEADRWPTLVWPREVPIAGKPAQTVQTLSEIERFMSTTKMPVLLLYADPGVLVPPAAIGWYTSRVSNLEASYIGQGLHFIQEDQPDAIGRELTDWMRRSD